MDTIALKNVNLTLADKGMVFILGKSGSGKSTLLNLLGGLDKPSSGEIFIQGKSMKNFTESAAAGSSVSAVFSCFLETGRRRRSVSGKCTRRNTAVTAV